MFKIYISSFTVFIIFLVNTSVFAYECLAPQSSLPNIDLVSLTSNWQIKNKEEKIAIGTKILKILIELKLPIIQKLKPNISLQVANELTRITVEKDFFDILNFTLFYEIKNNDNSSAIVNFNDYLKSEAIVEDIIRQMALFGRLQPNDRFVVSKKMTDKEQKIYNNKKYIDSQTPLNNHLDRISGEVEYYKHNGDKEYFIITKLKLLQDNMTEQYYIANISEGLVKPEEKSFVFSQTIPTNITEIKKIFLSQKKISFIDILKQFGYKASDVEIFQFERSSIYSKLAKTFEVAKLPQINYFLSNEQGDIHTTGILIGKKKDEHEQKNQRFSNDQVLHHVHPLNDCWLSRDDVLGSMALGLPCAITDENGIGLYFMPKFSREKEDNLQKIFKKYSDTFNSIMTSLASDKREEVKKNIRNQFALAFLSHFYKISKYSIPIEYSKTKINKIQKGYLTFFNEAA